MEWPGFTKQPCVNLLQQVPVPESQQMTLDDLTSAMITWHRYLHEVSLVDKSATMNNAYHCYCRY